MIHHSKRLCKWQIHTRKCVQFVCARAETLINRQWRERRKKTEEAKIFEAKNLNVTTQMRQNEMWNEPKRNEQWAIGFIIVYVLVLNCADVSLTHAEKEIEYFLSNLAKTVLNCHRMSIGPQWSLNELTSKIFALH